MNVKVVDKEIFPFGRTMLKLYTFDVVEHKEEAVNLLYDNRKNFGKVGEFGVGFLYEYPLNQPEDIDGKLRDYVVGADIFIYRGALDELNENPNPMIHSWTIENGKKLHRNKDGTMCTIEAIILGKEAELIRKVSKPMEILARQKILYSWPDIGDLVEDKL